MFDQDDREPRFASPFEPPQAEPVKTEGLQTEPVQADEPQPEPAHELPPYARPSYAEQPYTQQPYSRPAYAQQPYAGQQYSLPEYKQTPDAQPFIHIPPEQQATGPSPYEQFVQAQYGQQEAEPKRKKEKKRREGPGGLGIGRRNTAVLIMIIIVACVGSGVGGGLIVSGMNDSGDTITVGGGSQITIEPNDSITTTEAVAKKVLSSVVGITATGKMVTDYGFFGQSEEEVTGVGTGMIIDSRGYILTNSHVVLDGSAVQLDVLLSSGEEVEGKVLWSDTGLDLAIVKVEANGLEPIELGDSDEVLIGSYAAAVGNPLGLEFSGSITQGVVSGLDRTITVAGSFGGIPTMMQGLIQVDAAINNGNSGGPLLNSRGQVIGINTAKAQAEGMGFAIPINTAIPIVEKVLRDGSFERVFMGVSAADVEVIREKYPNVELKADQGACITDVTPGSPAEKGGLKVKDVITAIDGKAVTGSASLIKMLLNYASGDAITVTFDRNGEVLEAEVTLLSQSELEKAQQEENPFRAPDRGNAGR